MVQSFGSLTWTSLGGSSFAAASATLPYVVVRPEGWCVMTPLDTVHSATGTRHSFAAAWTSMARAALAHVVVRVAHAAAPGRLEVAPNPAARKILTGRRVLGGDLVPVAIQLLCDQLRQTSERALAHLDPADADHHGL